ncbi:MAG: pantoate--beta-alanine ligase [Caldisericaceae bacterium]
MEIIKTALEMKKYAGNLRSNGNSIGFVPTMGYLHEGHLSLIERAHKENDRTIVSIFVNPTQFSAQEDLSTYPRDLERDFALIKNYTDAVFVPESAEIYPQNFSTFVEVECLTDNLCGKFRPGHFRGVATVVAKLFNIVRPDRAYFGKKDYQQFRVIERMARDLNFDVKVIPCEIIREPSGLAMSSRNVYLSQQEKEDAAIIHKALVLGREMIENGTRDSASVICGIQELLKSKTSLKKIDYVSVVNPFTLQDVDSIKSDVVILVAAYFGKARLIDNIEVRSI